MTQQDDTAGTTERGAAEEASDAPLTQTEIEAGNRPPSQPQDQEGRPIEGGYGS